MSRGIAPSRRRLSVVRILVFRKQRHSIYLHFGRIQKGTAKVFVWAKGEGAVSLVMFIDFKYKLLFFRYLRHMCPLWKLHLRSLTTIVRIWMQTIHECCWLLFGVFCRPNLDPFLCPMTTMKMIFWCDALSRRILANSAPSTVGKDVGGGP